MDEAAVERYAQAIHGVREDWCAGQERAKFISYPWAERPEHMRALDRRMASAVADLATADLRARLDEVRQAVTTWWAVNGATGHPVDLVEGLLQILDRETA
jgi:hypothetical protein